MGVKIVFMGSATFALPSLNALFEAGFNIPGVITQPDKPSGRGQTLQGPPVKKRAFDLHLPIYQPKSLKTDDTRQTISALAPDLIVVVAYGKLLPPWLLEFPKYGCVNLHGSLLPKFRGAAPVHWAVARGEQQTGVCTMRLEEGLDTGPVYLCEETAIGSDETATELYDRLATIGAPLVLQTVAGIVENRISAQTQDDSKATFAPLLKKEDGFADWNLTAAEIHNRVRAFNPWPGMTARFRGSACKLLKTRLPSDAADDESPGTLLPLKGRLLVACGGGSVLEILSIQPENRKAVSGGDFANGARLQPGEKFLPVKDN